MYFPKRTAFLFHGCAKRSCMKHLAYFVFTILLASAICSCSRVQYIPVESVKHDSVFFNRIQTDSVYVMDSVLVVKGDTVTEYRWRYVYRYKGRTDTLYVNRTDSIRVPYPVEVEKKLTLWQRVKVGLGGYAIVAVIITVLIVFGRQVYKLKK